MLNTCPAKASSYSLRNISVIISSACLSEEEASLGEGFILSLKLFFYVASLDPKEFFVFFWAKVSFTVQLIGSWIEGFSIVLASFSGYMSTVW